MYLSTTFDAADNSTLFEDYPKILDNPDPSPRNNPTSYKVQTIRCGRFLIFQKMFQEVFEANEIQVEAYQDN